MIAALLPPPELLLKTFAGRGFQQFAEMLLELLEHAANIE
jgi:hypothetical protein